MGRDTFPPFTGHPAPRDSDRFHAHANAGGHWTPRALCGATLTYSHAAAAMAGAATNNPHLVTCPRCIRATKGS